MNEEKKSNDFPGCFVMFLLVLFCFGLGSAIRAANNTDELDDMYKEIKEIKAMLEKKAEVEKIP